jgi:hypothetical protein
MTMQSKQLVRTHLQAKLYIGSTDIGTARMQSFDADTDFGTEEVRGVGDYLQVEAPFLKHTGRLTLDAFLLRQSTLVTLGVAALGIKILQLDLLDLVVRDETGAQVSLYKGCTIISKRTSIRAGQICGENASLFFQQEQ